MSMTDSTRQAVARQRAAARGHPVRGQGRASSNPFSDDEDSYSTSGTSVTSRSSNPFDEEAVSYNRVPRHDSRERALRPTQDKASSGSVLGAGSNPFDEPEVSSKAIKGSRSQESSRRFPSSSSNPFDDEEAGSGSGSGSGHVRRSMAKPEESRRVSSGGNPFDDEGLVLPEKSKPRVKHNSLSAVESGSVNPFDDDYTPLKPKHNGLGSLERDSLFGSDDKPPRSQGSSRRNSGGSDLSEESVQTSGSPKRRSGRVQLKEKLSTMYADGVEKVSAVTEKVSAVTESVSTRIQKPRRSSRPDGERKPRQAAEEREALFNDAAPSRPPAPVPTLRYNDEGFEGQSVEQLRTYAQDKAKETTSSIENCIRVAESTRDVGSSTLAQLHEQGAQIRRTHEIGVKVDEELSTGEKLLGSLGGIFSKTWKPKKGHTISGPADTPIADYRRKEYVQQRASLVQGNTGRAAKLSSSQMQAKEPWEQEKIKQDDDLDKLSNILDGLKDMTQHMGAEIGRQNDNLEVLQSDVTELNSRVKQSNERGRKLLGR